MARAANDKSKEALFDLRLKVLQEIDPFESGAAELHYDYRALSDLHAMLKAHGDWMELGSKDEKQETKESTVEHWARSPENPLGGWYGLKKGFRRRFAMYIPPLMEALGLAEVEHNARDDKLSFSCSNILILAAGCT